MLPECQPSDSPLEGQLASPCLKVKPKGERAARQRKGLLGRYLDFAQDSGAILQENGLVPCGHAIAVDDLPGLSRMLLIHGPLIFGGRCVNAAVCALLLVVLPHPWSVGPELCGFLGIF